MSLPNFMIIGAQKCGTTWLDAMLRKHPQVFVSAEKELHFWDREPRWRGGLEAYATHFAAAGPEHRARGECTPNYLWTSPDQGRSARGGSENFELPARIAAALPDLKLIVLLRDPVQRAISAYFHHIRKRRVRPEESILDVMELFGIASMGYYARHLERWWDCFPREQTLVLFFEEHVRQSRAQTVARVFEHIGVDPRDEIQGLDARHNPRRSDLFMRVNVHAPPLAWLLEHTLPRKVRELPAWAIEISADEREGLRRHFEPHDARLSELLGRPLPWTRGEHKNAPPLP